MARDATERPHQAMSPANSCRDHMHILRQMRHQKADDESNCAPCQRDTNTHQHAMECTPAPTDTHPSQCVKQTERLREAKRRLRRSILTLALNAGLVFI